MKKDTSISRNSRNIRSILEKWVDSRRKRERQRSTTNLLHNLKILSLSLNNYIHNSTVLYNTQPNFRARSNKSVNQSCFQKQKQSHCRIGFTQGSGTGSLEPLIHEDSTDISTKTEPLKHLTSFGGNGANIKTFFFYF